MVVLQKLYALKFIADIILTSRIFCLDILFLIAALINFQYYLKYSDASTVIIRKI